MQVSWELPNYKVSCMRRLGARQRESELSATRADGLGEQRPGAANFVVWLSQPHIE